MLATSDQAESASRVAVICRLENWENPPVSLGMVPGAVLRKAKVTVDEPPTTPDQPLLLRVIWAPASVTVKEGLPLDPKPPRSSPFSRTP